MSIDFRDVSARTEVMSRLEGGLMQPLHILGSFGDRWAMRWAMVSIKVAFASLFLLVGQPSAQTIAPVIVESRAPLNFGSVFGTPFGRVEIRAATGVRQTTQTTARASVPHSVAVFDIKGEPNLEVELDAEMIGGNPAVPVQLEIFPGPRVRLNASGRAEVRVGGTINTGGAPLSDIDLGTLRLTARYLN
jgi:Domain of unknown function (DUF4402)